MPLHKPVDYWDTFLRQEGEGDGVSGDTNVKKIILDEISPTLNDMLISDTEENLSKPFDPKKGSTQYVKTQDPSKQSNSNTEDSFQNLQTKQTDKVNGENKTP